MAFPTGYTLKASLTIDHTKATADLTNFPVLLNKNNLPANMIDSDSGQSAANGGGDIRFSSDSAGSTQLACEVVSFVTATDPANAIIEVYVKIPSLSSSTDTVFYVWWAGPDSSQPAANDTYGSQNVWDSNFGIVMHLDEQGNGTADEYKDSTANGYHGIGVKTAPKDYLARNTGGPIGRYYQTASLSTPKDSDGGQGILIDDTNFLTDRTVTVDMILRRDTNNIVEIYGRLMSRGSDQYDMALRGDNGAMQTITDGAGGWSSFATNTVITSTDLTNWHHICQRTNSSNSHTLYIDKVANSTTISKNYDGDGCDIGILIKEATTRESPGGSLDEYRYSKVERAAGWVTATYETLLAPSTFITAGTARKIRRSAGYVMYGDPGMM